MKKIVKSNLIFIILILLSSIPLFATGSFLKSYDNPNETITNVRTICSRYANPTIIVLEGFNTQFSTFFTRTQGINAEGELTEDYSTAFVGEPLDISSGVCALNLWGNKLMTPTIEFSSEQQLYFFNWQYGYTDQSNSAYFNGIYLPDSLDTIVEFPTVMGYVYHPLWPSEDYLIGGRAIMNGAYTGFAIEADEFGYNESLNVVYFPSLIHISGLARVDEGYLAIGQAGGWKGRIMLVDADSNLLWQQDFTNAADASQVPMFTAPLMAYRRPDYTGPIINSYQDMGKTLHIAKYQSRRLQEIYSLPLDGFVGAIPLDVWGDRISFAYVKDGKQIVAQIDTLGTLLWTRELPGVGNFGKNCLNHAYSAEDSFILIGGRMAEGGYYLAKLDMLNGQIDYDTVSQPAGFDFTFYPNPGKGELNINLDVKQAGKAKLEIYNIKGQRICTLMDEYYPTGKFKKQFDFKSKNGELLPSGIYMISANLNGQKLFKKITIIN